MSDIVPIKPKASALAVMADRFQVEPGKLLDTLKATVFKGATTEQLLALVVVANEYQLNPFTRQIYAFPDKGGGITPVVGVDGWISLVNRQPDFDGVEFETMDDNGKPHSVTATIYVKGRSRPTRVTEYFDECARNTEPWNKSPRRMLRHRAFIQAARVAFGLGGIRDEDEVIETTATVMHVDPLALPAGTPSKQPDKTDAGPDKTPQQQLAVVVTEAGFDIATLAAWAKETGNAESDLSSFDDVPAAIASRLVKSKSGLLKGLAAMKEGK